MFNKENLDFLSTSPGNYIFKNKSNKSEFGKFSSIFHVLTSLSILLFYLISYIYGKEMNVIYSKKIQYKKLRMKNMNIIIIQKNIIQLCCRRMVKKQ